VITGCHALASGPIVFVWGWLIGEGTLPHALGKNMGETDGVDFSPEPVLIEVVAPDALAAIQILRSYIDDVASRYFGRQATDEEIDASLREDPSVDLALASGVFLVARQRDVVLGCAGLRLLPERVGEVKRLFVAPAARGRGLGARRVALMSGPKDFRNWPHTLRVCLTRGSRYGDC
jgi:GNAT superfamily N-acetyltransferase